MKKLLALIIAALMLCAVLPAFATPVTALALNNPLPDIYDAVSPSIVELDAVTWVWDSKTGAVTKELMGSGSAIYVDERGYFITNHHVIDEADELEIKLADGTTCEAFVVGSDEAADVAVIKIDDKFPGTPVSIGSSSSLRVGELVAIIGTPLDEALYNTMNAGIVAGLNRNDADYESKRAIDLIQLDIAVNPGNSGGALINMKGEVVGIPFMKYMYTSYTTTEGQELSIYENIAFAIPMDTAWPIAKSLIETGSYNRPRFGVSVVDNEGPDEPLKNFPPAGLMIASVEKNGSGYRAGLREGDVITHVNGTRITTFRDYTKIIDKLGVNESFEITVVRYKDENGEPLRKFETLTLTVTLEMID